MTQLVTMIIGEPAVGKSTLMRAFIRATHSMGRVRKRPYLVYHVVSPQCVVLGDYSDESQKYPGTDRMSMACQPKVLEFIRRNTTINFIFEGDRLGNASMIDALRIMGCDLEVVILTTPDLYQRQAARTDQTAKFHRSRSTKIANLLKLRTRIEQHTIPADTDRLVDWLIKERM